MVSDLEDLGGTDEAGEGGGEGGSKDARRHQRTKA